MKKYLPIITARGGSQGIHKKNVHLLLGTPLIAHTIKAYFDAGIGNQCFVSTDCDNIASISMKYGATIIKRPTEISQDHSNSAEAMLHTFDYLKSNGSFSYTDFILLQPTSPLRDAADIKSAVDLYEGQNGGSVVSMCEVHAHPYKCFIEEERGNVKPLYGNEYLAMPRQKLPKVLAQNGAIYITSISGFIKDRNFCAAPTTPYIMPAVKSIDIDTKFDLDYAEFILSNKF